MSADQGATHGAARTDLVPAEFDRIRRLAASLPGDGTLATLSDVEIARSLGVAEPGAPEICSIAPPAATALLRSMVDDGELQLRGERRGAHYVLPGTTSADG